METAPRLPKWTFLGLPTCQNLCRGLPRCFLLGNLSLYRLLGLVLVFPHQYSEAPSNEGTQYNPQYCIAPIDMGNGYGLTLLWLGLFLSGLLSAHFPGFPSDFARRHVVLSGVQAWVTSATGATVNLRQGSRATQRHKANGDQVVRLWFLEPTSTATGTDTCCLSRAEDETMNFIGAFGGGKLCKQVTQTQNGNRRVLAGFGYAHPLLT